MTKSLKTAADVPAAADRCNRRLGLGLVTATGECSLCLRPVKRATSFSATLLPTSLQWPWCPPGPKSVHLCLFRLAKLLLLQLPPSLQLLAITSRWPCWCATTVLWLPMSRNIQLRCPWSAGRFSSLQPKSTQQQVSANTAAPSAKPSEH